MPGKGKGSNYRTQTVNTTQFASRNIKTLARRAGVARLSQSLTGTGGHQDSKIIDLIARDMMKKIMLRANIEREAYRRRTITAVDIAIAWKNAGAAGERYRPMDIDLPGVWRN